MVSHAQRRALPSGRLPSSAARKYTSMPNVIEKTQHHFRYGVSPFRNATIYVITSTKKKIQNSTSGGIRKYALYCVKSASESPCFIRDTAAHTGTWKPHAQNIR